MRYFQRKCTKIPFSAWLYNNSHCYLRSPDWICGNGAGQYENGTGEGEGMGGEGGEGKKGRKRKLMD